MTRITLLTMSALVFLCAEESNAKVYHVGAGKAYTMPSQLMNLVTDGDTVEIDAGLYSGDVGTWHANNLVIRGVAGYAHLEANGKNAGGKAIWVITGNNTYIENIEFSGCTVKDQNGAGIRQEGVTLELRHCYFHDNDDGVLTNADPNSDILFEACEFARNGFGDGFSHNMYIGNVRSFTMRFCYSHHAKIGHCVKSRAMNNFIMYNRIMDEDTGSSSYLINLPNGGFSIILGNTMMKGPYAQNSVLVDYGSEGLSNPSKQLFVVNNTMISTRANGATFVRNVSSNDTAAQIINNIFAGKGSVSGGIAYTAGNTNSADTSVLHFVDAPHFDYHLKSTSIFYNNHGVDPGNANGFSLTPTKEYIHPTDSTNREDKVTLIPGAFSIFTKGLRQAVDGTPAVIFPNPLHERATITLSGVEDGYTVGLCVYDILGRQCQIEKVSVTNSKIIFIPKNLQPAVYHYILTDAQARIIGTGGFVIE
ncbi:MAG: T9SS type A sorting domain-containing protein [bacterium]